jgi:hypothetical protein
MYDSHQYPLNICLTICGGEISKQISRKIKVYRLRVSRNYVNIKELIFNHEIFLFCIAEDWPWLNQCSPNSTSCKDWNNLRRLLVIHWIQWSGFTSPFFFRYFCLAGLTCIYRVTHKGWDFRIYTVCFLKFMIPCNYKLLFQVIK